MSSKKRLLPEMRFPEFKNEGEWEEKKLGEVADLRGRIGWKGLTTNDYIDEGPLLLGVTNISSDHKIDFSDLKHIPQERYDESPEIMLKNGYLLLAKTGATIGKVCLIKGLKEPATVNAAVNVIECNESIILPEFLYQQLTIPNCQKQMWKMASPGAQPNLFQRDIRNIKVRIPKFKEQQKIASCLSSLDELIAAHNDKLEALKDHKKGLMQNLFPQEGQKVPNYRFPNFEKDGEWVEKELEKVCEVNPRVSELPDEFVYVDLESVSDGLLLKRNIIKKEGAPSRAQRLIQNKDVIYQMVRPYQKNNYYFIKSDEYEYVASTGYAQLRAFNSSRFLFQLIHTDRFVSSVLDKCTGSNYPAINSSALKQIKVQIPPTKIEQKEIASCLSAVDVLIKAQSEKIEQLQQHKKGLMQGLFPKINE